MYLPFDLAGPPEDPTRFLPLLIVLALAFITPILLSRFRRVPVVVGEIVLGVIVGPSVLNWVTEGATLTFLSDIGLAFLMFLAGMEIDINMLFPGNGRSKKAFRPVASSVSIYIATLLLAAAGALLLRTIGLQGDLWLMIFVLSATSLGVVLPILKERELLNTPFGQVVFLTAMIADFITVILLTVHLIILDKGLDLEIFSISLLFIAFLIFSRFGFGVTRIPAITRLINRLSSATVQIKVRGAIFILMAFVVLSEFLDAELILGAFLAGLIISLIKRPEDEQLVHNLEAFGFGFFTPVFFIMVGVDLNVRSLLATPDALLVLPAFILIALLIKLLPMLLVKRHFGWRDLFAGGFLLNTHLSLEVAVAVIGVRTGLFSEAVGTVVIVFAVITVLVMPLLFSFFAPETPEKSENYKLIIGASELGLHVAQQLRAHGDSVRFVVANPQEARAIEEEKFEVLDITSDQLDQLENDNVQSVLVLLDDDNENLRLARDARNSGAHHVIAHVRDPQLLPAFDDAGVTTFSPALQRATMLSMMARNPNILDLLTTTSDDRDSMEITLRNVEMRGKTLRELKLPGDLLFLAIRRNGELIVPHGGTRFELFDRVTILGGKEDVQTVRRMFSA